MDAEWPAIPYLPWRETCSALHLYVQIVGKYRLARTPWVNHSWHATLYVTARGLTTSVVADGPGGIEIVFDLRRHEVDFFGSDGKHASVPLRSGSVSRFCREFQSAISDLGGNPAFDRHPNEMPNVVPFDEDDADRPYDADAVQRFHQALVLVDAVLKSFRTGYVGKVSPVHLFWGSFDLAVTRFSGRRAPLHPGGVPGLPDDVTREAYSHEVSSAGFWPGGGGVDYPAFYSYAYPTPDGFADALVLPKEAQFNRQLGEFLLPYESVRTAANPAQTLLTFLQSTYEAAASLGSWPRQDLECSQGVPLRPRAV